MTGRDHYEVLGVARGASARDIRRAYRALALRYHPDVYSGPDAGSRFREIAGAYEVLQDPAQRARYDATPRAVRHQEGGSGIRRRSRDVPRFVDEAEVRPVVDYLIGALLRDVFRAGAAVRMSAWVRSGEWPESS
jgi:DnaJ-class molecular chaperone